MIREIDGNDTLKVVRILIQNMCTKVPDRAEYRAKISQVSGYCSSVCWVDMICLCNQVIAALLQAWDIEYIVR